MLQNEPKEKNFAVGGYGIWWPGTDADTAKEQGRLERLRNYVIEEKWNDGLAMWGPLKGMWQSSTRAELAALVIAMHIEVQLHVGIDNRAVVEKKQMH